MGLPLTATGEVEQLLAAQPFRQTESLLSDNLVLLESTSQTKEGVIHDMVDALYISGRTDDRQQLEEALWARETDGSTGFGHGFAIPHGKTAAVTADSAGISATADDPTAIPPASISPRKKFRHRSCWSVTWRSRGSMPARLERHPMSRRWCRPCKRPC